MEMKLIDDQWHRVAAGTKTVEIRLNDAKRRRLRVGDAVTFVNLTTGALLVRHVAALTVFSSFGALYRHYPPVSVGSDPTDSVGQMVAETYQIYTPAQELEHGVVAIELTA